MFQKSWKIFLACTLLSTSLAFAYFPTPDSPKITQFKNELLVQVLLSPIEERNYTHLYIVHHGDTDWTQNKTLMGWLEIPLNDSGRKQMKSLAETFKDLDIAAIYSSTNGRSTESAEILAKGHNLKVTAHKELRGETHGNLEGTTPEQRRVDPNYQEYKSISLEEKFFFSMGNGSESKEDIARRFFPLLREVAEKHSGQNVVIVTHGGEFKMLNYLAGKHTADQFEGVPNGGVMRVDTNGTRFLIH